MVLVKDPTTIQLSRGIQVAQGDSCAPVERRNESTRFFNRVIIARGGPLRRLPSRFVACAIVSS